MLCGMDVDNSHANIRYWKSLDELLQHPANTVASKDRIKGWQI